MILCSLRVAVRLQTTRRQGYVANGATVYICSRKKKVCDSVAADLTASGPGRWVRHKIKRLHLRVTVIVHPYCPQILNCTIRIRISNSEA